MAEEDRAHEGFLARWSRLKRSGGKESTETEAGSATAGPAAKPAATPSSQPAIEPAAAQAGVAAESEAETETETEIDLASLPPIESLTAESDITVFLRKGVPVALRNRALRRLWSLDPTIRDFIGPADYAWDWNVPGGAPGYAAQIASGPDVEALADRILGLARDTSRGEPAAEAGEAAGGLVVSDDERSRPEPAAEAGEADAGSESATPGAEPLPPAPLEPVRLSDASRLEPQEPVRTQGDAASAPATAAGSARPAPPRPRHGGAVPV
jgi:hypothetical protein